MQALSGDATAELAHIQKKIQIWLKKLWVSSLQKTYVINSHAHDHHTHGQMWIDSNSTGLWTMWHHYARHSCWSLSKDGTHQNDKQDTDHSQKIFLNLDLHMCTFYNSLITSRFYVTTVGKRWTHSPPGKLGKFCNLGRSSKTSTWYWPERSSMDRTLLVERDPYCNAQA